MLDEAGMVAVTDRALSSLLSDLDTPGFLSRLLAGPLSNDKSRSGILTEQSWLVAFSHAEGNDPVRRGRFISESLLCHSLPEVPIGVVPLPPPDDGVTTLRDRLAMHVESPGCRSCHERLEPLGFALEGFDHTGAPRTMEDGRPVDTSGTLVGSGDQDGPVQGGSDLATRLARSNRVKRCFLRNTFRFFLGRNEQPSDACTLARMESAHDASGGSFGSVLESLLTSDAFLYRAEGPFAPFSP
jgi:hypothetical protein